MRIAVMRVAEVLAAAVTCTGDPTVVPAVGEQMVTPREEAEHPDAVVATLMVNDVFKTAPEESQACTVTWCVPEATGRLTLRLAACTR